jgi:transcriptional regulator with XRE-family HTH domain
VNQESEIGKKVRKFRKRSGLTLQHLAAQTGFTQSYLSKVENSDKSPPVSTLLRLAKALKVSISDLFGEIETRNSFCLVTKNQRREMARAGSEFGYSYETLAYPFANRHMDPYILTLPHTLKRPALVQHEGEEMMFVVRGRLKIFLGETELILKGGDCLYFDSSIPHHGISLGKTEARILTVLYSPNPP